MGLIGLIISFALSTIQCSLLLPTYKILVPKACQMNENEADAMLESHQFEVSMNTLNIIYYLKARRLEPYCLLN